MNSIPLIAIIGAAIWVALCVLTAAKVFLLRKSHAFYNEHTFFLSALIPLALAPCVAIIQYAIDQQLNYWGGGIHVSIAALLMFAGYRARKYRLSPNESESPTTFREKSAVVLAVLMLVLLVDYFGSSAGLSMSEAVPNFFGSLIMVVILIVISHIFIALFHFPTEEVEAAMDERDKLIAQRSNRNSYFVLACGFWAVPLALLFSPPAVFVLNSWFACLVIAEIVKYSSVVMYYRLGEM